MKRIRFVWGVLTILLICILLTISHILQNVDLGFSLKSPSLQEIAFPKEIMFADAPFSTENDNLIVRFLYDDSFEPIETQNIKYQKIRWELTVEPKDGVSVDDFHCTLVLNDWLLQQSNSPSLNYIGVGKGYVGDMPEDSKGFHSILDMFIPLSVVSDPLYQASLETPVKLMLAYNDQEYYYWVTPTRAGD